MVARESPSKAAERRGRNERMILGEGFEKNVSSKKARERDFFYTFLESAHARESIYCHNYPMTRWEVSKEVNLELERERIVGDGLLKITER